MDAFVLSPARNQQAASSAGGAVDHRPVVAILGLYRGGTSCVAGILHHLGLQMGSVLPGSPDNPDGFYESIWLRAQLRRIWGEPVLTRQPHRTEQVTVLRHWRHLHIPPGSHRHDMIAVKHPLLCLMGPELLNAWGPATRFIAIYRPLEDCIASLQRVNWWPQEICRRVTQRLWTAREAFLSRTPHLKLWHDELLADPATHVRRIAEFLSLNASGTALAAARDCVRPPSRIRAAA
jgi:hypothetical protein